MLDLYELEQLAAFGEYGTLSRAAEQLHISQPTITRSMRHLEDEFGVPIFLRTKNRIELNAAGKLAVECARRILSEAEQSVSRVRELDRRMRTIVVSSCAPAPLWELLRLLEKKRPGITVSSVVTQNDEVLRAWEGGCDLAVLPFQYGGAREFMREKLFVCIPAEHDLAKCGSLSFADINGFNFLLRSELGFWDSMCRQKMPASKFLVQTDEFAFNELIRSSSLPCFVTDYILHGENEYSGRRIIPISDPEAEVTFWLLSRCGGI